MNTEELTKRIEKVEKDLKTAQDFLTTSKQETEVANAAAKSYYAQLVRVEKLTAEEKIVYDAFDTEKKAEFFAASEDQQAKMLTALESENPMSPEVEKRLEELQASDVSKAKRIAELEETTKKQNQAMAKSRFETVAEKDYPNVSGTAEEKGQMLLDVDSLPEASKKSVLGVLTTANDLLGKQMSETGSSQGGNEGTAWSTIEAKAKELAKGGKMTVAEATDQVMKDEPALYTKYLQEEQPDRRIV